MKDNKRRISAGHPALNNFIGFNSLLDEIFKENSSSYPPYNIVRLNHDHDINESEKKYLIELALAGFNKDEISVSKREDSGKWFLCIDACLTEKDDPDRYIHKGISNRNVHKRFVITRHINVDKVKYENGILKIFLTEEVPRSGSMEQYKIE